MHYKESIQPCFFDPRISFLIIFIGIYLFLSSVFLLLEPLRSTFMIWVTYGSAALMQIIGLHAEASTATLAQGFTEIRLRGVLYQVHEKCTGLPLVLLVAAAVAAVPASIHHRLAGAAAMVVVTSAIACMRILILGLVAEFGNNAFEIFHTYIMEVLTVALGISILTFWCRMVARLR